MKTIRHSDCIEAGHDRFDEFVSTFLGKIGETNVVSITPVNYAHTEHGGDRLVTDYGLGIVYKIERAGDEWSAKGDAFAPLRR